MGAQSRLEVGQGPPQMSNQGQEDTRGIDVCHAVRWGCHKKLSGQLARPSVCPIEIEKIEKMRRVCWLSVLYHGKQKHQFSVPCRPWGHPAEGRRGVKQQSCPSAQVLLLLMYKGSPCKQAWLQVGRHGAPGLALIHRSHSCPQPARKQGWRGGGGALERLSAA